MTTNMIEALAMMAKTRDTESVEQIVNATKSDEE